MGEVIPILVVGFVILFTMVIVIAKTQLNRKAVVKPMDQEDMVERLKIRLTAIQIKTLGDAVMNRTQFVDTYETGTDRMLQFHIIEQDKQESKKEKK